MEENTELKSKYNSGVNILIRLDALWKDANNHSRSGQYSKWNNDLDTIWSELARDLKEYDYQDIKKDGKVEKKGYKTLFEEFDSELAKTGAFEDDLGQSLNPLTKEQTERRQKQYRLLREKELFLRRLENHLGKGTAWEDEDGYDFD
jgi:hypothetical protein